MLSFLNSLSLSLRAPVGSALVFTFRNCYPIRGNVSRSTWASVEARALPSALLFSPRCRNQDNRLASHGRSLFKALSHWFAVANIIKGGQ
jgi:hypothetical protein